jgi:hypothetical protein
MHMLIKHYIIFPHKAKCGTSLPPVVCRRAHVIFTLFVSVCALCCSTQSVLYFCFLCLHLVYPMLQFLWIVHCYCPSVCSNVYFSCVLCTLGYSFSGLFIVIAPSVCSNVYFSCVLCTLGYSFSGFFIGIALRYALTFIIHIFLLYFVELS